MQANRGMPNQCRSLGRIRDTNVLISNFVTQGRSEVKSAVVVVAKVNFRDEELLEPKEILEKNNVVVRIASTSPGEITGMLGAKVKADILIKDINVQEFDAIVFVGGTGASQYWNDPVAHKLIQDALRNEKIVAAICIAPVTLANSGILKGKRATVWSSESGQLKANGAVYTAGNVETDGNIITAAGPFAAREFGEELAKLILSK